MLSYRHAFHAGNAGDVLKHAVLAAALGLLVRKDKPLCYLDCHAGAGRYDLADPRAAQTGEHRDGIGRVWERTDVPAALQPYRRCAPPLPRLADGRRDVAPANRPAGPHGAQRQ